jgi:hypothetical protein
MPQSQPLLLLLLLSLALITVSAAAVALEKWTTTAAVNTDH